MPPLDDVRQEHFARYLYEGIMPREAYVRAGYEFNQGNAYRLKNDERIQARIREMHERAARVATLSKAYVLEGLMEVVEKSLRERPVLDKKGNATGMFVYDSAGAVRALELLGKTDALKMFSDRKEVRVIHSIEDLTTEEKIALAKSLVAGELTGPVEDGGNGHGIIEAEVEEEAGTD